MDSDGSSTVALTVASSAWRDAFEALEPLTLRIVLAVLDQATAVPWLKTGEVSLLLTDDTEIRALNASYRARDRATNVLSFPGLDLTDGQTGESPPPGPAVLGDVVISFERLTEEADQQRKDLTDHFAHLLVHGTLHLLGYDHRHDAEAQAMEGLEASILKTLGFSAPYAAFAEAGGVDAAT